MRGADGALRLPARSALSGEVRLIVRSDELEEVLDRILPLLPQGVHEMPAHGGTVALAAFGPGLPLAELEAAAGAALLAAEEGEAPDDPAERRLRLIAARPPVAGVAVRPSGAGGAGGGLPDVVIDSPDGAFGAGTLPDDGDVPGAAHGPRAGRGVRRPRLRHGRAR